MINEFLLPGILIGVGASLTPGPVLLLVMSETLQRGVRAGLAVAVSPLFVDIFFVPVAIIAGDQVLVFPRLLVALSVIGAAFLVYLGIQNLRAPAIDLRSAPAHRSFIKGFMTDMLGPFSYLFWFSVALPIFAKGTLSEDVVFAAGLSIAAITSNSIVVLLVFRLRERFLRYIPIAVRILGLGLLLMALLLLREGMRFL